MSADRAALVAGICASPEDDAPRLVCADWFQEQGDAANVARAEFIRTQIERANLPPTDPRQSELRARELRLLKRHGAAWIGSHFAFKKCRFRRGFIEYVHLHLKHFLHHRRQLCALDRIAALPAWGRLRALACAVPAVPAPLRVPEGLRALRLIGTAYDGATVRVDDVLARCARVPLEVLDLQNASADAGALGNLFAGDAACALGAFAWSGEGFTAEHARALAQAPKADRLHRLTVSSPDFNDRAAKALFGSGRLRSVAHLTLYGRGFGDTGLAAIGAHATGLHTLEVYGAVVTARDLAAFLDSPAVQNLARLTFTGTAASGGPPLRVTAAVARRLAALPHLTRLDLGAPAVKNAARDLLRTSDTIAWCNVRSYARQSEGRMDPWDGEPPLGYASGTRGWRDE